MASCLVSFIFGLTWFAIGTIFRVNYLPSFSQEPSPPALAVRPLPGCGGHHRLRYGHRQTRRQVRHPPLDIEVDGELLPGVGQGGEGRSTSQVCEWFFPIT